MVKNHSASEKGNPLPPHRLLLSINSKGYFICTIPDRITHTTACYTSCGALAGTREREMFYLTTHSTHFIYGYLASGIWLRTIQIARGNPLPPHGLLFPISSKGSFICTIPDRIAHTTAFVIPVVEHWLEREIAQWVHPMKDRSDDPPHHEQTLYF